jgi:DUF1680 family protein
METRDRPAVSRRDFLQASLAAGTSLALAQPAFARLSGPPPEIPLEEFSYEQVAVNDPLATAQRDNVTEVLAGLDEDSLLKPFREMAGQPAPGISLGGWYEWKPDYNFHHDDIGLAPGANLGQWVSALSRLYASSKFDGSAGRADLAARAVRLNALLAKTISSSYFEHTRFAGYSFDKIVCGLMDAHRWAADENAFSTLDAVTAAAKPVLPSQAVDREVQWSPGADLSWMWDETYTLPENLYIASSRGAGPQYLQMARAYLDDVTYFQPLSSGVNALSDKHAYSYVNALCSAMQAFLVDGSAMHLAAAKAGFDMLQAQSFATGGWGPDEVLRKPGYDDLSKSLTLSHNSFETPCGSYAHMKLTRYLLRVTRDGRYGDSMERIMLNTVRGALPLQTDGRSFYYADYNVAGKRIYSLHRWPCCSGTLPQVVADYGINGYYHQAGNVWINLYQASELRWEVGSSSFHLEQSGSYLDDGKVHLRITASHPAAFALHLRVPAWAGSPVDIRLNGRPVSTTQQMGFLSLQRLWRSGDTVELTLPMSLRLESLPANGGPAHPDTVALLWGPLVLFPLREAGDVGPLSLKREDMLRAERSGPSEWRVGQRLFVPFVAIGDRPYSTYVLAA